MQDITQETKNDHLYGCVGTLGSSGIFNEETEMENCVGGGMREPWNSAVSWLGNAFLPVKLLL